MKKVTLQFDNILSLIDYLNNIKNYSCQLNRCDLMVTCELSEADIELALNGYQANILQPHE
ncbi:MAG TPA: hypothetical protein VGB71_10665 [Flavisolibacter sp.]